MTPTQTVTFTSSVNLTFTLILIIISLEFDAKLHLLWVVPLPVSCLGGYIRHPYLKGHLSTGKAKNCHLPSGDQTLLTIRSYSHPRQRQLSHTKVSCFLIVMVRSISTPLIAK
uniref:Uncharacterized protein n=1 Tax=Schistocephalus solidus TaxID=70667 RepID=A0A0X3NHZ0_SCHSO